MDTKQLEARLEAGKVEEMLGRVSREAYGFLTKEQVARIANTGATRLRPLLVRFQEGRLTAPAQDVAGIIEALERGGWHVRDVCLPAGDSAFTARQS